MKYYLCLNTYTFFFYQRNWFKCWSLLQQIHHTFFTFYALQRHSIVHCVYRRLNFGTTYVYRFQFFQSKAEYYPFYIFTHHSLSQHFNTFISLARRPLNSWIRLWELCKPILNKDNKSFWQKRVFPFRNKTLTVYQRYQFLLTQLTLCLYTRNSVTFVHFSVLSKNMSWGANNY